MGKQNFGDRVRECVGSIGWRVFLWSIRMTDDQYHAAITADVKRELRASAMNAVVILSEFAKWKEKE